MFVYTCLGSRSSSQQANIPGSYRLPGQVGLGCCVFLSMSEWAGLRPSSCSDTPQKDIPSYHLVSSTTEEPAEICWIPGLDRNNNDHDNNNNNIKENNSNTYCIFTRCRAGTALSSLRILTYLMCLGSRYYYYTHFTEDKMEAEEVEELAQDRKTSRGHGWMRFKLGC